MKENGGTRNLLEEDQIARTLRDFAKDYYGQANSTLFRHGEDQRLISYHPMSNPVYRQLLDGSFDGIHGLTEYQKYYIKHKRSKVLVEFDAERGALSDLMTLKTRRNLFLKAREQMMAILIRGLRLGIYKTCTRDNVLAMIQMTIVSMAFEFGLKGVRRWC